MPRSTGRRTHGKHRPVEIIAADTPALRREFVRCAAWFYRDLPAWVPPLESEQLRLLDPARSEFLAEPGNAAAWFLARRDGRTIGRIGAFRNAPHLSTHRDGAGFFGFFECVNEQPVAAALLQTAGDWLRAQGLTTLRGPANFNIHEEAGVLLDSFDMQPMLGMTYTPAYYAPLLEACGMQRCRDLYVYRVTREAARLDRLDRLASLANRIEGLSIRPVNLATSALPNEARIFAAVWIDAWQDNWGAVPIPEKEFRSMYERYRIFLIPELVYLAEVNGEPAAAFVMLPDMNVLIKRIGGRLWPFGWLTLLLRRRSITRYRTLMMGVRPKFRRLGLPLLFIERAYRELLRRGVTEVEFSWILEDNRETRGLIERIGGHRAQTLRLYEKALP